MLMVFLILILPTFYIILISILWLLLLIFNKNKLYLDEFIKIFYYSLKNYEKLFTLKNK